MKALVGAFKQEKALVWAFSVIVKTDCEADGSFYSTNNIIILWMETQITNAVDLTWAGGRSEL